MTFCLVRDSCAESSVIFTDGLCRHTVGFLGEPSNV